ncbi:hypothetical protein A4X03_0g7650 [Tilletia caries]|uniref:Uncharacterized protein n=2 Tax=Tilletia caries TaxID=13290 RepID=A0A8T8SMY9_9BASI|nr:hypothetical protein CF335_g7760 [Tilletia laevis]KAE8243939.1 hypothetical protein A4X03_0g7650 [Tilletia caries]
MRAVMQHLIGLKLHLFKPYQQVPIQAKLTEWNPRASSYSHDHVHYWLHHHGPEYDRLPHLQFVATWLSVPRNLNPRELSVDIRIPNLPRSLGQRTFSELHTPKWITCANILTRILVSSSRLEVFNIRMSAQTQLLGLIEQILRNNPQLNHVNIDVDTAHFYERFPRPTFNLAKISDRNVQYRPFTHFVFRGPNTDVLAAESATDLLRFSEVKVAGFATAAFFTTGFNDRWAMDFMRAATRLQAFEFSVGRKQTGGLYSPTEPGPIKLPDLTDLILDFHELDYRILILLQAPLLNGLRLRSNVDVARHGACRPNHFPSLFVVNIVSRSPSALRLAALGIARWKYEHNLFGIHNDFDTHSKEFQAYIKPYARVPQKPLPTRSQPLDADKKKAIESSQGPVCKRPRLSE